MCKCFRASIVQGRVSSIAKNGTEKAVLMCENSPRISSKEANILVEVEEDWRFIWRVSSVRGIEEDGEEPLIFGKLA